MATLLGGIVLLAPVRVALPASAQSADYFVEAFGDPLDFSNQEDAILNTNDAMMFGTTNRSMSDGQLHFDTAGIFRFDARGRATQPAFRTDAKVAACRSTPPDSGG